MEGDAPSISSFLFPSLASDQRTIEEIRLFIEADTLAYLSPEGLMRAMGGNEKTFCAACFTGHYPTPLYGLDKE